MEDLELFLYASPDEDNSLSDEITCVILDDYIQSHGLDFDPDSFKSEQEYMKKARKLANNLKKYLEKTDINIFLKNKHPVIDYIELVVEYVDGPEIMGWTIWKNPHFKNYK